MFDKSKSDRGILQTQSYLTTTHEPEKPIGRDTEQEEIAAALRPLIHGKPAQHLLVSGPTGVGKSTTIRHTLEELSSETRVKTAHINCWQYNTRPSFLTELLVQLGYPAPRKGKPVDQLMNKLNEWLDKNRGLAVALDEFDQLSEKNEIIYDLHLLNRKADSPLGLIMVANTDPDDLDLDPRSESRLSCKHLGFEPYDVEDLMAILKNRTSQAFAAGSITDDAIERIATLVVDEGGDCRRALELLRRAGQHADYNDKSEVTKSVVEEVVDD